MSWGCTADPPYKPLDIGLLLTNAGSVDSVQGSRTRCGRRSHARAGTMPHDDRRMARLRPWVAAIDRQTRLRRAWRRPVHALPRRRVVRERSQSCRFRPRPGDIAPQRIVDHPPRIAAATSGAVSCASYRAAARRAYLASHRVGQVKTFAHLTKEQFGCGDWCSASATSLTRSNVAAASITVNQQCWPLRFMDRARRAYPGEPSCLRAELVSRITALGTSKIRFRLPLVGQRSKDRVLFSALPPPFSRQPPMADRVFRSGRSWSCYGRWAAADRAGR